MRCEICGAPLTGDRESTGVVCSRCSTKTEVARRLSSFPAGSPQRVAIDSLGEPDRSTSGTVSRGFSRTETVHAVSSDLPEVTETHHSNAHAVATLPSRPHLPFPSPEERPKTSGVQPSSVVMEGKYRLIDELGRGSMGTVFLAEDILLKRKVAVKFLLPELAHAAECSVRFKREAIAMASIRNENVAQIYSYGEDRGTPYFVMEYLEGQTVEELVDAYTRRGLFTPLKKAINIMIQVISGVSAIHGANAVHRDIKPGNIMITSDPMRAVIMDFGLVRDVQVEDDMRTIAGTPAYIAPELVEGRHGASKSKLVDIYSLGATFYEVVTGAIPFNGTSWVEILQKHIAEIPQFPSIVRPGLPEAYDELILRAMAKEPQERYQTCDDFLDALLDVYEQDDDGEPVDLRVSRMPGPVRTSRMPRSERTSRVDRASRPPRVSSRPLIGSGTRTSGGGQRSSSRPGYRNTSKHANGTLLVADADMRFRSAVYTCVKAMAPDIQVHSATDGLMTLDLLKTYRPNVVILNLALPQMNGFEIVASIVGEHELQGINVIVVSENDYARDAQLLRAMGVDHFWTKPVDTDSLVNTMMPWLEFPNRS
jgi:serine/threonine protein kinase